MRIFDTNIWVAYLNTADSQHAKATKLFEKHSQDQLAIPEYVILEVSTILAQRASKQIANQFLDFALDNENIAVLFANRELFDNTVAAFQQQRSKRLSFVDTALVALAKEHQVITFDKALNRALKQ